MALLILSSFVENLSHKKSVWGLFILRFIVFTSMGMKKCNIVDVFVNFPFGLRMIKESNVAFFMLNVRFKLVGLVVH